jgi:hypothetical protein
MAGAGGANLRSYLDAERPWSLSIEVIDNVKHPSQRHKHERFNIAHIVTDAY